VEEIALNRIDLLALVAVLRLGDEAYGVTIHEEIERAAGRHVSLAGVYSALDRLERGGLTRVWHSDPRPERGGRARRHYGLTAVGRSVVRRERDAAQRIWDGLSPHLDAGRASPAARSRKR
jgi:DNA-binding PadR family transcriptional regulator